MALLMAFALSGCGDGKLIKAVQQDVVKSFLDPQAAQFSGTKMVSGEDGRYVCGFVNGKNTFGGYVGARPYWGADLRDGLVTTHIIEDGSETPCDAFERTKDAKAADAVARSFEDRDFERVNTELRCRTAESCSDTNGLGNSL